MERNVTAVWSGGLKNGGGTLATESATLSGAHYSLRTRFDEKQGTNPEELIASAHAACFSMTLAAELEKTGLVPDSVETRAAACLENTQDGWRVTCVRLKVSAQVPGASEEQFSNALEAAKQNSPISKLLNTRIVLQADLVSSVVSPLQEAG